MKAHKILPNAQEYKVIALHWRRNEGAEDMLDLTLQKAAQKKVLRFYSPTDLKLGDGFPDFEPGFFIWDVTEQQLEKGIKVGDIAEADGAVNFYARAVEEVF